MNDEIQDVLNLNDYYYYYHQTQMSGLVAQKVYNHSLTRWDPHSLSQ